MKRVLFVWDDIGGYGGVRTQLLQAVRQLPEMGFETALLDWTDHPSEWDEELVALKDRIVTVYHAPGAAERGVEKRVHQSVQAWQPQAVVFAEWRHAEDVLRGCPDEVAAYNLCLVDRPDASYYQFADPLLPRLTGVMGNSRTITGQLRTRWPAESAKIHDWFTGVPVSPEEPDWEREREAGPLRILYMARLEDPQKRASDLIPLVAALDAGEADYRLTVVGDGPVGPRLEEAFAGNENVALLGALPFARALELFGSHDVLLLVSAYEGMPLVVLHALAEGLVPVCSDIESGISQLRSDGAPIPVFPVGDMETAATELAALGGDRPALIAQRQAAHQFGARLDIRKTVGHLAELFANDTWPGQAVWQGFKAPADPPGMGWRSRMRRRMSQ